METSGTTEALCLAFNVGEPVDRAFLLADVVFRNRFIAEVANRAKLNSDTVSVGRMNSTSQTKIAGGAFKVCIRLWPTYSRDSPFWTIVVNRTRRTS